MRRRLFKGDNPDLSTSLNNIAAFYNDRGYYSEAEPFYVEALEMNKRIYKNDHPNLAGSYLSMAYFYIGRGRYAEAEPLLINSLEMYRRLYKLDHPNLVAAINNTAMFYNDMGRYDKAEALYKESLEMNRRLYKIDNISLAVAINNMAYFYEGRERYADAEPLFNEALEMRRRLFKGDQPDLATSISNLGGLYEDLQEYEKAEPLYKEGLAMRKRLFNSPHPAIAQSLNILATFYFGQSRYTEAEPLYKEALEMRRKLYNSDHQELSRSIKWTARFYEDLSRYFEAETLFIEGLQVNINMLNNYFPSLSEKEKKQFWNIVSNDFQWFNNFGIHRYSENKKISGHMYDFQLYSKSLLLNSSSRIKNRILNSGDSALVSQYQRWSDIKEYLVKLYKMSNDELKKKNLNLDSIETIANNLEKELSLKSEAFKQSFEKKKVTWKSIQTLLKPDEAAVEVVRFRYKDKKRFTDTIYYAFLIVTDQTEEHPDLVVLENGNELENEFYTEYRNNTKNRLEDKKSFDRYWSKLYEKTKGYKRIFFSADGVYNKLNPSTFKLPDGKFLIDVQDIQQVNTTKDLLTGYYQTKQESNIYNSALLIGNPNFSLSEEQVQQASRKIRGNKEEEKSYESLASTRGINLTKLPGTEKEINDIEKFLKGRNWIVNSYLGDSALKTAVTTANNPRVLHIATHGLFLEDVKRESKGIFGFDEKKMIENPLLRSGLFFTGADNYLKKENPNLNDAEDNGLLTAYEAMNLDLDKTELVVLSACETGLGEIQNGEGVFGLRRAFQQAGAKTIMMSLWKVNDDATQQLMSSFYKNWVTGMTKRDAFSKAQQEVRTKYKDPYYWGAFVMVGE
jgi:tetratricopeptide (TPR) repeat protein